MSETVLQLDDVAIFQKESLVLNEVSLEVKKGEFVYLIGKTGSGKSSFMKTLYGDLPLQKGAGNIVGFDLKTLKENDIPYLRRKLGIVFQDFHLIPNMTALENVALPLELADLDNPFERARASLDEVGLSHQDFKVLPDRNINNNLQFVLKATGWKDQGKMSKQIEGVLDKVGMKTKGFKFPHELSGGEQQRIAIARALLNDPELILADEPTGNLDPQTSVEVMKVLQDINKSGRTILMATHDYALILKYPSKTLKCDGNKVFEVVQRAV